MRYKSIVAGLAASALLSFASPIAGVPNFANPGGALNEKQPMVYKDMIEYMKQSNNAQQYAALGGLYAFGAAEPDSTGATVQQDTQLAEKYLLKSAELGNKDAYAILGSIFYFHIGDMAKGEKYLKTAFDKGDMESGVVLADLLGATSRQKQSVQLLSQLAEKRVASAELSLAFVFKDGMLDDNATMIVAPNMKTAEFYLTRACTNQRASDKVREFCNNPALVRK